MSLPLSLILFSVMSVAVLSMKPYKVQKKKKKICVVCVYSFYSFARQLDIETCFHKLMCNREHCWALNFSKMYLCCMVMQCILLQKVDDILLCICFFTLLLSVLFQFHINTIGPLPISPGAHMLGACLAASSMV